MAITDEDRDRLYATLRRQLGEDDARTLITMLSSNDPDSLASRAQLDAGIERLDARLAGLDARVDGLDVRLAGLDARVEGLDVRLAGLDARVEGLDVRVAQLEARVERLEARVEGLDARVAGLDVRVAQLEARVEGLVAEIGQLRQDMREGLAELQEAAGEQTRTFVTWMFALLTVYTVMAGSFVALGTLIVAN